MHISRKQGGADLALEQCSVATADTPPEWVARGQAKFLGARRWDPPVEFSVWFVEAGQGRYAACAIHLGHAGQQGRAPVRKPHSSCAGWTRRS